MRWPARFAMPMAGRVGGYGDGGYRVRGDPPDRMTTCLNIQYRDSLMIGRLTGIPAEKIRCRSSSTSNGVGYELDVPMSTFYNLRRRAARKRCSRISRCARDGHFTDF